MPTRFIYSLLLITKKIINANGNRTTIPWRIDETSIPKLSNVEPINSPTNIITTAINSPVGDAYTIFIFITLI